MKPSARARKHNQHPELTNENLLKGGQGRTAESLGKDALLFAIPMAIVFWTVLYFVSVAVFRMI